MPLSTDPNVQQAVAATAAASGAAAWWATAADLAQLVFGVPVQVILAAATGAFAARSYKCSTTYLKALGSGLVWTLFGVFFCQAAMWMATKFFGDKPPPGALTGVALLVAAGGQLIVTKDTVEQIRKAAGRLLDGIGRKK